MGYTLETGDAVFIPWTRSWLLQLIRRTLLLPQESARYPAPRRHRQFTAPTL